MRKRTSADLNYSIINVLIYSITLGAIRFGTNIKKFLLDSTYNNLINISFKATYNNIVVLNFIDNNFWIFFVKLKIYAFTINPSIKVPVLCAIK